jgi:hypothetical protein
VKNNLNWFFFLQTKFIFVNFTLLDFSVEKPLTVNGCFDPVLILIVTLFDFELNIPQVCETTYRQRVVEEDFADCRHEQTEICRDATGCPTVPTTKCTIQTRNSTKEFPETEVSWKGLVKSWLPLNVIMDNVISNT